MANSALIQGAGQVYRAQGAKTLAMGSGMAKGGTAVVEEYFKQKEERDKTDKQNASLAAIYQQTAVNEQGLSPEDFAQIQKETQAHNQMIIDLSKQGLDPTLYQATLTNKTRELEGRLKIINNTAVIRTTANGLIRAHGDDKIGMKLSEHFRATEGGALSEKVVDALANGKYQYGKENGVVIIDGERYTQTQLKEHVDNYKSGMYNVFEAGGVKATIMDQVTKLQTPQDLGTWKKAREKMYNWKTPAVISKIKKELVDTWELDASYVNNLTDDKVKQHWLDEGNNLADEFAKIATPYAKGKNDFQNYQNRLNIALKTKNGVANLINKYDIEWGGKKLLGSVDTKDGTKQPSYNSANGNLTIYLEGEDDNVQTKVLNMGNLTHRSIFEDAMAFNELGNTERFREYKQYGGSGLVTQYNENIDKINELRGELAKNLESSPENWDDSQKEFFLNNVATFKDLGELDDAGILEIADKAGLNIPTDPNQQEQKLEVDKIEQVKVPEPVKKKRRMIWQEEFIDTGEFQDYLTTIGVKGSGFAYDGKGRVLDEIVNRKDFKDKFGKVYPANTYRTGHLATYPHDKTGMTITQGQIMGQEITFSNTGRPQLDTTIVQARQTAKEKANEQFKKQYLIDRRNYSLRGKPGDDLIVYYKLSKDNPDIPELSDDKFVNFIETGKLDAEYRKAILDNSKEFSDELVKLVKKAEPNIDYSDNK